ncbi:MAG: DMT family transporter [Eubacteriales bacterium]|nr:DMT family transporter [Eubacteriales bacterium]
MDGEVIGMKMKHAATFFAILAAALYAVNIPISKYLLEYVDATMMAGFLYLGAGVGMILYGLAGRAFGRDKKKERLTRKELPYTVWMVILDIAAPILLMFGIARTNSANVSLLNNFEIVATSLIAFVIFKEVISKKLWIAISLVTVASVILSFEGEGAFIFNEGSLFVLGACTCWGLENNCTKMISNKSSEEIVIIKGCFSGAGSILVALVLGENIPAAQWVLAVMLLGFVAYGLSINFYIMAQKDLGAAKTSAYYSIAPFLGVAFSMILLGERPAWQFYIAFIIMVISTVMMIKDSIQLQHTHEHAHTHTHEHSHGDLVHTHEHTHVHSHLHIHDQHTENHEHTHHKLENHNHLHTSQV